MALPAGIPSDLEKLLGGDDVDVVVKATRRYSRRQIRNHRLAGWLLTAFGLAFAAIIFVPLAISGEARFEAFGEPAVATWEDLEPATPVLLVAAGFGGLGLWILSGLRAGLRSGPWVAVSERGVRIHWPAGSRLHKWSEFTGNHRIEGDDVLLELQAREVVSTSRSGKHRKYRQKEVVMAGVPDVGGLERACRRRLDGLKTAASA